MFETPPIYFSSLEIEDVRCFGERQVLRLTDDSGRPARWTLLIGENGTGKTSLLECLAWMRPVLDGNVEPAGLDQPGGPVPLVNGLLKSALTDEENDVLEALPRGSSRSVSLGSRLSIGDMGLWPGGDGDFSQAKTFDLRVQLNFNDRVLQDLKPKRAQIKSLGYPFVEPLIVSYGANRYLGYRNSHRGVNELPPRSDHERLSTRTELYDIEEILMNLDYAARADSSVPEGSLLNHLKEVISRILPDDLDGEGIQIHPPDVLEVGRRGGVYVKTFTGLVRMSALSLGYRTTAGWVFDLAWRFLERYRGSPNPLAEPAVVLVDEIDLHLHPRWQLEIIKSLSTLFPATQFIATSHSPLMVQVAEETNLVLLRRQEGTVEIVNNPAVPRNLRVDQILTSLLFGVPSSRGEHIQHLLDQRAELIDKTERSQDEEIRLRDISQQIYELPTAQDSTDQAAMDLIRQFATILENREAIGQ